MPYPAKPLSQGEEVLEESKQHWIALRDEILYTFGWLILLILLVPGLDFPLDEWLAWLATVAWAILVGSGAARWYGTDLIVTNKRLIYRRGLFAKAGHEMPVEEFQEVGYRQTRLQRLVGAGDLLVESATGGANSVIRDVQEPVHLAGVVGRAMEPAPSPRRGLAGAPPQPEVQPQEPEPPEEEEPAPRAGSLSRAEQLEIIARLHDQGKLTDDEFNSEKRKLLGGT